MYVAVKGGERAIKNAHRLLAQERRGERATCIDRAIERFPVLGDRRNQRAGSLSGGEQQMLALARALAVSPKLVIADEMSLGLAPLVAESVFEGLEDARRSGMAGSPSICTTRSGPFTARNVAVNRSPGTRSVVPADST